MTSIFHRTFTSSIMVSLQPYYMCTTCCCNPFFLFLLVIQHPKGAKQFYLMTGDAKALLELQITVSRMGMYNNYFLQRGKNHHNSKKNTNQKNPTQQTHTLTFQVLTASASRPASTVLKTQGEFFVFCLGFSPPHH